MRETRGSLNRWMILTSRPLPTGTRLARWSRVLLLRAAAGAFACWTLVCKNIRHSYLVAATLTTCMSTAGRREVDLLHEHLAPCNTFSVEAFSQSQCMADFLPQEHVASLAQMPGVSCHISYSSEPHTCECGGEGHTATLTSTACSGNNCCCCSHFDALSLERRICCEGSLDRCSRVGRVRCR